jgi:RNA polymerase sigma factor (sigma-70 family)
MSALAAVTRPTDQGTDDLDLVAGVRARDDRAFELLFLRYQPRIAAYVRGMVNDPGRAEDITQEVFMSALRRMRETDREIAFKPWIYEIAKNACIDSFRRSRCKDEISFDAQDALGADDVARLAQPGATPDSVIEGKVALDNLCGAFGGLSQTHHEILVMREFEGLSYCEISERLGMSRAAVESTLFRARRRLGEEYDELVSGQRCVRVQRIVDAGGGGSAGLRDQRRLARHLSHCQPCRRYASLAGVDVDAVAKRTAAAAAAAKAARIAAFIPLPIFLRRRVGAEEASQLLGQQSAAPIAQWTANVAGVVDPTLLGGWTKAVATAATVAVAGVGAGAAMTERDGLQGFIKRVPVVVPGSAVAGSGPARAQKSGGDVLRRSVSAAGTRASVKPIEPAMGRVRRGTVSVATLVDGAGQAGGSLRSGEPGSTTDSSPLAGSVAVAPDRGAASKRKMKAVADKLDRASRPLDLVKVTSSNDRSGGSPGAAGSETTDGRRGRERTLQRVIDTLVDIGVGGRTGASGGSRRTGASGSGGSGRTGAGGASGAAGDGGESTIATKGVGSTAHGLARRVLPALEATGPAAAPATASSAPAVSTSAVVADTVSDVSDGLITTALSPAQPPS